MAVRAMMRVLSVKELTDAEVPGGGRRIVMQPIADQEGAHKSWSRYTPSGELRLDVTNADAYGQFEVGKLYALDFTRVD